MKHFPLVRVAVTFFGHQSPALHEFALRGGVRDFLQANDVKLLQPAALQPPLQPAPVRMRTVQLLHSRLIHTVALDFNAAVVTKTSNCFGCLRREPSTAARIALNPLPVLLLLLPHHQLGAWLQTAADAQSFAPFEFALAETSSLYGLMSATEMQQ